MTVIPSAEPNVGPTRARTGRPTWQAVVARYERMDGRRAVIQLMTTLVPLGAMFFVMYQSLALPYWVTLLLAVPTAGLLVRTFIIMHDCAHRSFLASPRANDLIGMVTGVITLTPFGRWRREHAKHHASSGDLDRRGHGDIPTLTVREYQARTRWGQLRYRLFRHPIVLIGLGPLHMIVLQRLHPRDTAVNDRQSLSVWSTNLAIVALFVAFSAWIGPRAVLLIYLPAIYLAAVGGVWLFYVQHQFEDAYWKHHADWDYATAAIRGSSYFKLPQPLEWVTGSIGLHHVHHLGPRIPNYHLKRCHDENPMFHDVTSLTLRESARTLRLALWDEDANRLIAFSDLPQASTAPRMDRPGDSA
ncbi:MAG: fatty acid desaturase [Geminicoccaceae bacterium]|nr:fatty acid desaturase [Geminicoccaceae bacterium]